MKTAFVQRSGTSRLLLFFNGWGMDSARFSAGGPAPCDVLAVDSYDSLAPLPDLFAYREVILFAWSLGVWAAASVLERCSASLPQFAAATALNGTLSMLSARTGIAPEIFHGTGVNWSDSAARARFQRRLNPALSPESVRSLRSPDDQQTELFALEREIAGSPVPRNPFRRAVIGTRDRVVDPAAQRAFWAAHPETSTVERDLPHDPFGLPSSWKEVLSLALD